MLLADKVVPLFRRGDYDTAVFAAFKEVEVRVREAAGLPGHLIGVSLMREAFRDGGPLANMNQDKGERVALMETFAGAIGMFKNPGSHRSVEFSANDAAALIHFASYLLLVVETRGEW